MIEAEDNPVGRGRSEPNHDPYLPLPMGRLQFTANPFMMLKELLGPKACLLIICCCVCVSLFVAIGLYGNLFLTLMMSHR
jgi:hypothetical protein